MAEWTTAFLSGVSAEFRGFRLALKQMLEEKGCHVVNQDSFGTDWRTVEAKLRDEIGRSDFVVHLAGFRYGAEPQDRPADRARRSYTQIEVDIARALGRPVYRFISADPAVRDAAAPGETVEGEAQAALQQAHRAALQAADGLWYAFDGLDTLLARVASIPPVAALGFREDVQAVTCQAAELLVGREDELAVLHAAWVGVRAQAMPRTQVLAIDGLAGEGKTALVARWLGELAAQAWSGCARAFAWRFPPPAPAGAVATGSADAFLDAALRFFGDPATAASATASRDKGRRLAERVAQQPALLVLDGLDALQHPVTGAMPGRLADPGLAALLHGLAASGSQALCVVTSSAPLADLAAFADGTAQRRHLGRLTPTEGGHLLRSLGVHGTGAELERLVDDLKGHALTLQLMGRFLRDAFGGDVRLRDRVQLAEADAEVLAGQAFEVASGCAEGLAAGGAAGQGALALWQLLALFDGPADAACWAALLAPPAIMGLTDGLQAQGEVARNLALSRLERAGLLTLQRDTGGALLALDTHPLLRAWLARRLRQSRPQAWREGHRRLFEHLCRSTPDRAAPTLDELLPLFRAVHHGCQAGLYREARDAVYIGRLLRGTGRTGFYCTFQLGALASELAAVSAFFDEPWSAVTPALDADAQAWVLHQAGFLLRALGRLDEAVAPQREAWRRAADRGDAANAAIYAGNLSDLALALGDLPGAREAADHAIAHARDSRDRFAHMVRWTTRAHVRHQAGDAAGARADFEVAEGEQAAIDRQHPLLYSVRGFQYDEWWLAPVERLAWQRCSGAAVGADGPPPAAEVSAALDAVAQRAARTLAWAQAAALGVLDAALDRLTLARVGLLRVALGASPGPGTEADAGFDAVIQALRGAGLLDLLATGLLARAWHRSLCGRLTGAAGAQADLDEAWTIAERGPMRLLMVDVLLTRARLFGPRCGGDGRPVYPWTSAARDLAEARRLIEQCGYGRRREELDDAEAAARRWPLAAAADRR